MSAVGWTPLFYLLANGSSSRLIDQRCKRSEFISIFESDEHAFLDLELRDPAEITVLEYTVRFGDEDEVDALLRLGAQLSTVSEHHAKNETERDIPDLDPWSLPGSAMSQAIASGNFSTFRALFKRVPLNRIDSTYGGGPNGE